MILAGLLAAVFVAQLAVAKSWVADDTADHFATAMIWYGTSILHMVALVGSSFKVCEWQYITTLRRNLLNEYRRWGMERELGSHTRSWLYGPMLVLAALWSLITFSITIGVFAPVIGERIEFLSNTAQLVATWLLVGLFTFLWCFQDRNAFDRKRKELSELRSVFRRRFPVSELLSMYDCLRVAPDVFWQEYKSLSSVEVNQATNRRFRERAAPYANRGSNIVQRRALLIAGAAALIAILTFVEASLDGGSVEWVMHELFSWGQKS